MDVRYPVGRFQWAGEATPAQRAEWIGDVTAMPGKLRSVVAGLTDEQLDTPYRPDGWTVRQVVHHLADSHMTMFTRYKLALTEETPTVKPYKEALFAETADAKRAPVEPSLQILAALHQRWVELLTALSDADFRRTFVNPESGSRSLEQTLGVYAWHGRHHMAHITGLKERNGWS